MTPPQVKEQLNALIDNLPQDQAQLVLDFANLLHQRRPKSKSRKRLPASEPISEWEKSLATAETYWFELSESTRQQYTGRVVALLRNRILDSDVSLQELRRRVNLLHPDQPILYLDANAEQEPALFVRSPRLR
jgi:hypothetical protein